MNNANDTLTRAEDTAGAGITHEALLGMGDTLDDLLNQFKI